MHSTCRAADGSALSGKFRFAADTEWSLTRIHVSD
jgi:hypothetical protein